MHAIEAVAGNIHGPNENGCVLDGWPVGEIENQIELSTIAEMSEIDEDTVRRHIESAANDCDSCVRVCDLNNKYASIFTYQSTDAAWYAIVDEESLREVISCVSVKNWTGEGKRGVSHDRY